MYALLGPNLDMSVVAASTLAAGTVIEDELAVVLGVGVYGPCRIVEASEGTCSQLRPVDAADGVRGSRAV